MTVTEPASAAATELVEGKVYAVGGVVEVDGRISWFPPEARGFAYVNSYLLVEGDDALLLDTGMPVHEALVVSQLRGVLGAHSRLGVFHTRIVEFDSVGNTAALVRELPVDRVYAHFPPRDWVHYQPKHDVAGVVPGDLWPDGRSFGLLVPDVAEPLRLGPDGERVIDLIPAPLRVLATYWLYDRDTKTLFTSDTFSHGVMETATDARIADGPAGETPYPDVLRHLLGKFDWLGSADTTPLRAQLAEIFESHDIETIAPGFGRILRGRECVAHNYALLDRALAEACVTAPQAQGVVDA